MDKTYVKLDGYTIRWSTWRALMLEKDGQEIWLPRSQFFDGDHLDINEGDLACKRWLADKYELDYEGADP